MRPGRMVRSVTMRSFRPRSARRHPARPGRTRIGGLGAEAGRTSRKACWWTRRRLGAARSRRTAAEHHERWLARRSSSAGPPKRPGSRAAEESRRIEGTLLGDRGSSGLRAPPGDRRAADPARSGSGCRTPAPSRRPASSPSPRPACGRSRGPSPEPEKAYSPGFWRRRNGSNSVAIACGGMPRPVSRTENSTALAADLARRDLDEALGGELERVGREVEQHPAQRHRMPDPEIGLRRRQAHRRALFSSAIGCTMSRTDSRMSVTENGIGSRSTSRSPPARQLDHVARHRAEAERRAVDQARAAAPAPDSPGRSGPAAGSRRGTGSR